MNNDKNYWKLYDEGLSQNLRSYAHAIHSTISTHPATHTRTHSKCDNLRFVREEMHSRSHECPKHGSNSGEAHFLWCMCIRNACVFSCMCACALVRDTHTMISPHPNQGYRLSISGNIEKPYTSDCPSKRACCNAFHMCVCVIYCLDCGWDDNTTNAPQNNAQSDNHHRTMRQPKHCRNNEVITFTFTAGFVVPAGHLAGLPAKPSSSIHSIKWLFVHHPDL